MQELKCPNCGEVFQVDESDYAQIVSQIRDKEFEAELGRREAEDKIIAIYNALFVTDLNAIRSVNIGECRFDEGVRSTLFRTVSLLSEFTNLYLDTDKD